MPDKKDGLGEGLSLCDISKKKKTVYECFRRKTYRITTPGDVKFQNTRVRFTGQAEGASNE